MPPAAVAGGTTTAAAPSPGRQRQHRHRWQQPPKATRPPLPTLLQRPRLPPPPPAPRPIEPIVVVEQQQDEAEDDGQSTSTVVDVLRLMDALRLPVEADLYASLLRECTERRDAAHGAEVHAHIRRRRRSSTSVPRGTLLLANRLLLMYAASGRLERALEMFDGMPTRDSISWATMMAGLSGAGDHGEALRLFAEMMHEQALVGGGPARILSIATALDACAGVRDLASGRCVHGLVLRMGVCGEPRVGGSLIRFYGMLGQADGARKVFGSTDTWDPAVWDAMVSAYCRLGLVGEALELFRRMWKARRKMRLKGALFSSILRACGRREEEMPGRQVHACAVKHGVDGDGIVQGSLVEMYGRCGLMLDTRRAALEMTIRRRRGGGGASSGRRDEHDDGGAATPSWNALLGLLTGNESSIRCLYLRDRERDEK